MLEQVEIGEQVKSVSPEALDPVYSLQTSVRTRPYSLEGTCKCQKKAHIEVGAPYPHQLYRLRSLQTCGPRIFPTRFSLMLIPHAEQLHYLGKEQRKERNTSHCLLKTYESPP